MDKKIFWLLFTVLGALMGLLLPLWWNLALPIAAAGAVLVGGVPQRMVLVEKSFPPKPFHPLQRE